MCIGWLQECVQEESNRKLIAAKYNQVRKKPKKHIYIYVMFMTTQRERL